MKVSLIIAICCFAAFCTADVYLQYMRGSNDRLNEANTNRNNGNRLFDSQNNAKGGYCYGPAMTYYESSLVTLEWTSQHGCGSPKQECNMVIQYMCGNSDAEATQLIRDGGTTETPPNTPIGAGGNDITRPLETAVDGNGLYYGMHESYYYYRWCRTRSRNLGLYIADRNVATNAGAAATRQNNNGAQSGYECPEERDYYPYWHPSPWKDVAILTDNTDLCGFFQSESQNVKSKGYCYDPADVDYQAGTEYAYAAPNNPADCAKAKLVWTTKSSWGNGKPDCLQNPFQRDNHLGNVGEGYNAYYNWTLPSPKEEGCIDKNNCNCVMRLRYNISTYDFGGFTAPFADATNNGAAKAFLTQNPDISAIGDDCSEGDGTTPCNVTLAINTAQFARTFQDRSYVFHIAPRPKGVMSSARIFNLNVKGKRGNIVETYPATEYDFHPNHLNARVGDYIHFQWTGCDTNPAGNAGEGKDGTDRSNMVQIESLGASVPASGSFIKKHPLFEKPELRNRMAFLDQTNCKSYTELQQGNKAQDDANCMNLNAAEQYFNGGLIKMNKTGTFYYMNSRSNNFSNRGQKGTIIVTNILPTWGIVLVSLGAALFVTSGAVAGAMFYAKTHPHSGVATALSRL